MSAAANDELARQARRAARERRRAAEHHDMSLLAAPWGRALAGAVALLGVLTVAGLAALWPGAAKGHGAAAAMGGPTVGATVVREGTTRCAGPVAQACRHIVVRLAGNRTTGITLGPVASTAPVAAGTRVRVQRVPAQPGAHVTEPYTYAGVDRRTALLWLAVAFVALLLVLTRLRGLLALVGFGLSLLLVTRFLVPAILDGRPGLLVGLAGALAVMFVTVLLTYGLTPPSLAACLGIGASLLLAALAAAVAAHAAHLDGRSNELATYLANSQRSLSLPGVVLAGVVVGALGVLADMGVTQASAVMALRRANPGMRARRLFREAFAVGRDHLVATTHTLVLVYVGASLPLLLVMRASGVGATDALNSQDLAEPIVATLVGAIALLVSVPLTTALTAAVVARIPAGALGGGHVHAH